MNRVTQILCALALASVTATSARCRGGASMTGSLRISASRAGLTPLGLVASAGPAGDVFFRTERGVALSVAPTGAVRWQRYFSPQSTVIQTGDVV